MATLTLYTNPQSRGRIARFMLEEVGEPYETNLVSYGEAMKSAAYLAINPMGKVPALTYGDVVVSECAAICAYLADAFPAANLAPPLGERGAYYRWLFFAAGPLEAATTAHAIKMEPPEERAQMLGYGSYKLTIDTLETALSASPYLSGQGFSAADVYVGSQVMWGRHFDIIPKRPAFEDYVARITAREAFQRARAIDDASAQTSN